MRSSDASVKKKTVSAVIRLIGFILCMAIINRILAFMFMLPLGYSRTIMHEAKEKDYDCVMLGSSEVMYAMDNKLFDEIRGTQSMTLGTEATYLNGGELAVFYDYMKDHDGDKAPKTVILMQGTYEIFNSGDEDPTSYSLLMPCLNHLSSKLWYYSTICDTDGLWLERFIYWKDAFNTDVKMNVTTKISNDYRAYGHRETPDVEYAGHGHIVRDTSIPENIIDYSEERNGSVVKIIDHDLPKVSIEAAGKSYIDALRELDAYCDEHNMRLIIVMAPTPVTGYYNAEYYNRFTVLTDMADELGLEFYDLNQAESDVYDPDIYGFYDLYHVNGAGSEQYTKALAEVLNRVDSGESADTMFHNWDETCIRAEEILKKDIPEITLE